MNKTVGKAGAGAALFLFSAGILLGLPQSAPVGAKPSSVAPDHAGSYYHFMLARRYEELAGINNSQQDVDRAIAEFKQAIADDPSSLFLHAQLGDLYWHAGRPNDAVAEAQFVLKANPNDLDAHRLLGQIYVQELGQTSLQASVKGNLEKAIREYETISRLDPSDTHSEVLLGRLYQLNHQPDQATQIFKKILDSNPNSAEALTYLGRLYVNQEHYKQAIQVLEKVPEDRRGAPTFAMLGIAYSQSGQFGKAAQNFKSALNLDPVNLNIQRQYADALMRSDKTDAARSELQKILKSDPKDGRSLLRLAQIDQTEGHFKEATAELDQASKLMPGDPEIAYTQAQLEDTLGHEDAAVKILKQLLAETASSSGKYTADQATDRGAFLERLGLIYRSQQNYKEAISTFQQMAALGGSQAARGESLIVETLQLEGQLQNAANEAHRALQKYPNDRPLNVLYASVLGAQGHVDEAVGRLRSYIKTDGENVQAELAIVQIYSQAKRYRDAQRVVEGVLQSDLKASDKEYAQFLLGSVYERQKKYGEAEQQFKAVLAVDPMNAAAYNYLGYMLADRGIQLEQSVDDIKKALQIQPNNGAYLDSLGWAYYKMNRYDLARAPLEKAARLMPNDPTVLMHLGDLYLKLGQKQMAVQTWKQALKNYPSSVDTDFDSTQANKLQKRLHQVERQIGKQ